MKLIKTVRDIRITGNKVCKSKVTPGGLRDRAEVIGERFSGLVMDVGMCLSVLCAGGYGS